MSTKAVYFLTLGASLLISQAANASYYIASKSRTFDPSARTHIVVAGKGDDLGLLPQYSANMKVVKLIESFPSDQVVLIAARQPRKDDTPEEIANTKVLKSMGYKNIQYTDKLLSTKVFIDEVSKFSQIASFHTYGHSAITPGIFLDGDRSLSPSQDVGAAFDDTGRFSANSPQVNRLAGHFTQDAFAILNGCNGGHIHAPIFSKKWGIPVAGAMTGTHFEAIFSDGQFYTADAQAKVNGAMTSIYVFETEMKCRSSDKSSSSCIRMRPEDHVYNGHYGKYTRGLPFYKFFCAGISEEKCLIGMARSILSSVAPSTLKPNSTFAEYAEVVQDFLCPSTDWGGRQRQDCINNLNRVDFNRMNQGSPEWRYSPYKGTTAQCDFQSCYPEKPACLADSQKAFSCARGSNPVAAGQSTTFMSEYYYYLRAFQYLQSAR